MTKICKVSVEKPRKSSRTTKSPFKLSAKENESKFNDPIILLSDPLIENSEKLHHNEINSLEESSNNSDLDDFISAYCSDSEEENDKDQDPNGDVAYLKLKGVLEQFLRDSNIDSGESESGESDDISHSDSGESYSDDNREGGYIIEYREGNNESNPDDTGNMYTDDTGNMYFDDTIDMSVHRHNDKTTSSNIPSNTHNNSENAESLRNPLLIELDFIEMIEELSQILIIKYILKVLGYVRNLQLKTLNENIKKRIVLFFKYINEMPDSEIRKDCEDLKNDLIELNEGEPLENFPQSGVILIDLIDGKNKGLSSEEISKLSSRKYTGPTQNKCSICFSDIEDSDDVINLKTCSHEYHATCLVSWLKISNQCPICRNVVVIN